MLVLGMMNLVLGLGSFILISSRLGLALLFFGVICWQAIVFDSPHHTGEQPFQVVAGGGRGRRGEKGAISPLA